MKYKALAVLLASTLLGAASAQDAPSPQIDNAKVHEQIPLLNIAADVAANQQGRPVIGDIAVFVDQKTWSDALSDGDLGPFAKLQDAKPERAMICIVTKGKNVTTCVFFDSSKAIGEATARAGLDGKMNPVDVASAYKQFSKSMLKTKSKPASYNPGTINADDGAPLTAYQIH